MDTALIAVSQCLSNNFCPQFTDEECITIYLWGITQQKNEVKSIYEYILDYYEDWFPKLPDYQAFNNRICNLADTFEMLADIMLRGMDLNPEISTYLTDCIPVMVASAKRSYSAQVTPELCNKGYCESKQRYYYGVKLHALGKSQFYHHAHKIRKRTKELQEKTHIQTASKLRSTKSLLTFVFARASVYCLFPWSTLDSHF